MSKPRTWADWEYLGEDENGVVLVSVEDCPDANDAMRTATEAAENVVGLDPLTCDQPQMTSHVVCLDPDHEQGDCTNDSPCNALTEVWLCILTFPEDER